MWITVQERRKQFESGGAQNAGAKAKNFLVCPYYKIGWTPKHTILGKLDEIIHAD